MQGFEDKTLSPDVSNLRLWRARQLIESAYHPQTKEEIFPVFRFSAFALVNIPICASLIYPTNSLAFIAGAQWFNQVGHLHAETAIIASLDVQSFNVALNYANRNASSEMQMSTLGLCKHGRATASKHVK